MTIYSVVLFVHVVSALGLFAVLSFEAATLRRLRNSRDSNEARVWLGYSPDLTAWTILAFVLMLFSGIYLTAGMSGWMLAWPRVALGTLVLIGPLGGIAGRKMRAIRAGLTAEAPSAADLQAKLRDPFLKFSMNLRIALVLGIVLLMTQKPELIVSLAIVGTFAVLGVVSTFLFWRDEVVSPMARVESR